LGVEPKQDTWWYDYGDGTWAAGGWYWIDGNRNGIAECYCFDKDGWLLTNRTTADGYQVNHDGAWIVDGVVQTRIVTPGTVISSGGTRSDSPVNACGISAVIAGSRADVSDRIFTGNRVVIDLDSENRAQQQPSGFQDSYARQVFDMVNAERTKAGKTPLAWAEDIGEIAEIRVEELSQQYSHIRPDGQNFLSVWDEHNIPYKYYGENIAMGQDNPEEVMGTWMNSEPHQNNILDEDYTHMAAGSYYKDGQFYWIQLFVSY